MGIDLQGLTKRYGNRTAVDGVTLHIDTGMYGLLGPNGAGKTTLMRMLCTLLTPTSGEAILNGIPITKKTEIRRIIGYLPQDFSFYPSFTVTETLDYLGLLSGMKDTQRRRARIEVLLEQTNLADRRRVKVRQLSGGQRRRLGIAQTLLADPGIMVVDEPTAGLDPEERIRFRNLLSTLAAGKTVLLSTHIAEDVLQTCANVAVLDQGKLMYAGGVQALIQRARGCVWEAHVDAHRLRELESRTAILSVIAQNDAYAVRVLAEDRPCEDATSVQPGLEDAYMLLIRGGHAA